MTPYEMRQKASRNRIEANVLDESAQILRSVATSIDGLLSGVAGMSRMVWQGPAATEFEQEAEAHSRSLDEQAALLGSEATGFSTKAANLRAEANWLVAEAARLEAAAAAGAPNNVW